MATEASSAQGEKMKPSSEARESPSGAALEGAAATAEPTTTGGGTTTSNNDNPLFNLVNAASILDPSPSKDDGSAVAAGKDDYERMTSSGETAQETSPSSSKGTASSGDKKESPAPNVLPGTKEDLMLDPKIKISFGEHLYNVLENEEHHDVLNWMPDGKSFTVVNHKKFVLQKMPNLFQIRNMSSFVRKLGRWGFTRAFEKETNNSDVFKHPHFIRGDRAGVRKNVKCLGRSAAPKRQAATQGARQPDFVVRQEPGKPPMVMPTPGGAPIPAPLMSQLQFHPPLDSSVRQQRSLSGGGFSGPFLSRGSASGIDDVASASAASAEALYLSHQQQQKIKMERLAAADQQRLEDMEIERLMKRREMRQQQQMQQQFFMEQQRRLMIEKNAATSPKKSSSNAAEADKKDPGSPSARKHPVAPPAPSLLQRDMDISLSGSSRGGSVLPASRLMYQDSLHSNTMPLGLHSMDLRRVSMQHGATSSLDGSLGRSTSSRFSVGSEAAAHQVTPVYDTRKVLTAAYETLQRDEMKSLERQAAIRALLAEEQEFEARRRAAYNGPSAGSYSTRG